MCSRARLYAAFHSIPIGFEGAKLKIVDQKASDGRVSQIGCQFLRWLCSVCFRTDPDATGESAMTADW